MKQAVMWVTLLLWGSVAGAVPSVVDFNVVDDNTYATEESSLLRIHALDANKMNFSCDNATYGGWKAYATTAFFNLKTGAGCANSDGAKTVYVKVWNVDSNLFAQSTDAVTLDTTHPTIDYVWHDANQQRLSEDLNADYNLALRVSTEAGATVTFSVGDLNNIDGFDDGAHNDSGAGDGVFGGKLNIKDRNGSTDANAYVIATVQDVAGNYSYKLSFTPVTIDLNVPTYAARTPANWAASRTPAISVELIDVLSDINKDSARLWLNNGEILSSLTLTAITDGFLLAHTPSSDLSGSSVDINVFVQDYAGNVLDFNWTLPFDLNAPGDINGFAAVALKDTNLSDTNDINVYWFNAVDAVSGVLEYRLYRHNESFNDANLSNATRIATLTPAAGQNTFTDDLNSDFEDNNVFYGVKSVDSAGNVASLSTLATVRVPDVSAPTSGQIEVDAYLNTAYPTIKVTASDLLYFNLSCDANKWHTTNFETTTVTTFNIADANNGCSTSDGNRLIYARLVDAYDNNRNIDKNIHLDRNTPSTPGNLTVSVVGSNLLLAWSASSDTGSGIHRYRVYEAIQPGVTKDNPFELASGTTWTVTPYSTATFYYRVRAVDRAGNLSDFSNEVFESLDRNAPALSLLLQGGVLRNGARAVQGGTMTATLSSNHTLTDVNATLVQTDANDSNVAFVQDANDWSAAFTVDGNFPGEASLRVSVIDSLGLSGQEAASFMVDVTGPDGNLALTQQDENTVSVRLTLADAVSYRLEYLPDANWLSVMSGTNDSNAITDGVLDYNWDVSGLASRKYGVRAIFIDDLNNEAVVEREFNLVGERRDPVFALAQVEQKQAELDEQRMKLSPFLLESDETFLSFFEDAQSALEKAKNALHDGNDQLALETIDQADTAVNWANALLPKVRVIKEASRNFDENREEMHAAMESYFSGEGLEAARELLSQLSFTRVMHGVKAEMPDGDKHYIVTTLEIANPGDLVQRNLFVTESIPKALAEQVQDLTFNSVVEVVEDDPVVYVYIPEVPARNKVSLVYRTRRTVSPDEWDAIIGRSLEDYGAPVPSSSAADAVAAAGPKPLLDLALFIAGFVAVVLALAVWRVWSRRGQ